MTASERGSLASDLGISALPELPAASSFLSSRWSRDNLLTSHPAQLYTGALLERIELESLEGLVHELEQIKGPIHAGAGRMGVYTWDVACRDEAGAFVLQVPLVLDEPGKRERAKRDVPRRNLENMSYFTERGLGRYVMKPRELLTLGGNVPAATFTAHTEFRTITFGCGALEVELVDAQKFWLASLGPAATAELLAEMMAALVYHYEPEVDGGTALADVCVNDGDFVARRHSDGTFEVRLTAARHRESGIGPSLLLLYLIQLMAYEDWNVDDMLTGLPLLMGNPSVAFEGVTRGLRYRYRDLGLPEERAAHEAKSWIEEFGRSREGRSYRPWVDRFLAGRLPLTFGDDLREHWWRLIPLQTKLGLLELRARLQPAGTEAVSAKATRAFLERLTREIGRTTDAEPPGVRLNDLARPELLQLLDEANLDADMRERVADEILAQWPYRSLEQLTARVPGARPLRRFKSRISFGRVVSEVDQGTLRSLPAAPKEGASTRPVANLEIFGALSIPTSLHATATRTFASFEAYMDAALQDPTWGYYAQNVVIGSAGHFQTHPEELAPHYGQWLANWAFKAWREMRAHSELSENDGFPVIEFGAGNGRLARDFLDAVAKAANDAKAPERAEWQTFSQRLRYHVYEMSESLRERQRALLGESALVAAGDARNPAATLSRDFPNGVKGLVVTNEVPDAFGVHKVVLTREGHAWAALVVARVEPALLRAVAVELAHCIAEVNSSLRETFGFREHADDLYLDDETFARVMRAIAELPADQRDKARAMLWFEEAYVPAAQIPELAAHLRANASQYAIALAAEDSGVVCYVNLHANRFMRELAASLRAGLIITIDYGDTTWGLIQGARHGDFPFRVYGEWQAQEFLPRPNDPYAAPGTQDLTADVNFTDLAQAGVDLGLEVLHFAPERDITGDALPRVLEAAAEQSHVAKFLGNPVFKLLVLGRRSSELFKAPLMSPLALSCREQDVPKSRRGEIPRVLARLIA